MYAFGDLKIVAGCDIGQLGPKEGQPISYYWSPVNHLVAVLPWLALIAAFLLRENRSPAAILIVLPMAVTWLAYSIIARATGMPSTTQMIFTPVINVLMISFSLVWLLAERIGRRNRFLTAVFVLLVFVCMLGLAIPAVEKDQGLAILGIFQGFAFAAYAVAFTLAMIFCRKRLTGLRFGLWLLPGCLAGIFVPLFAYFAIATKLEIRADDMLEFLIVYLIVSGFYYIILLPYLVLFFKNSFWRRRFEAICVRKKAMVAESSEVPAQS